MTPDGFVTNVQLLVNIDVDDLDKAADFYARALGLRKGRRLFNGSVVELVGGPSPIHLLLKPAASAAVPNTDVRRAYSRHWTPVHLDFVVEDVTSAVERAIHAGATLEGGVETFEWGRLALMSDPFGHGFCLVQLVGEGFNR
jgi:predicted enzyme related to lactoylglutathione lyase